MSLVFIIINIIIIIFSQFSFSELMHFDPGSLGLMGGDSSSIQKRFLPFWFIKLLRINHLGRVLEYLHSTFRTSDCYHLNKFQSESNSICKKTRHNA